MGLRQRITILILLAVAGAALVTASLYLGLPASGRVARIVFLEIRLPRLLVGAAAGAGLGVAGLLVQRAMRNPLAVPDLLGVSGGAAFVAALLVTSGIHSLTARTAGALAGAVAGGALCLLAAARGRSAAQTLLIGAAVSTAWQAAVLTVMSTADQVELSIIFKYLVGSLTEITADAALPLILPLVIGCAATVAVLPALGVLSLGDEQASALGMRPGRWRLLALGVAALLVALVVAACGPIAWVAFVAPTVTRWFVPAAGEVFRLAVTAIIGAGVSVGADIAARELFKPFETPLGAWTALIGFCVAMVFVARRPDR